MRVRDVAARAREETSSLYSLMVNTNKIPTDEADAFHIVEALRASGLQIFNNDAEDWLKIMEPGASFDEDVDQITVDQEVERGPEEFERVPGRPGPGRGGRVHLHAVIKIDHRTRVQLDIPMLQALFVGELNARGVDVNSVAIQYRLYVSQEALLRYISKDSRLGQRVESGDIDI